MRLVFRGGGEDSRRRDAGVTHRPHRFTLRDGNQAIIGGELRRAGFEVLDVSPLGGRVLDLLVIGYDVGQGRVVMRMVEVKVPGEERALTDDEAEMLCKWPDVCVLAVTAGDVLRVYGRIA